MPRWPKPPRPSSTLLRLAHVAGERDQAVETVYDSGVEAVSSRSTEFTPAMAENAPVLPFLSPVGGKPVHVAFDGGRLTSDAGVLVLAEVERKLGLAERLARCINDPRDPQRVTHQLAEMIRFRTLLVAAGYADANDCDALRADPAFKMAVGRLPESGAELCSQPTMSRLENLPTATALKRMMAAMVELFCDSFTAVPRRIVLDIEPGSPRTLFVGWGRHRGPCPRPAAAVTVQRSPWRALLLANPHLRGGERQAGGGDPAAGQDAGWCRGGARAAPCRARDPRPLAPGRDRGARRQPLQPARGAGLAGAAPGRLRLRPRRQPGSAPRGRAPGRRHRHGSARRRDGQGPPLRRVPLCRQDLAGRTAGHRPGRGLGHRLQPIPRRDVSGADRGTDSRFIVTNLPGAARWLYEDVYCARGQAENLIKAHKLHLASDRTSCSKAAANQFRQQIHTAA
jgi:hypothetical protein